MQKESAESELLTEEAVDRALTVTHISHQRMRDVFEVITQLVPATLMVIGFLVELVFLRPLYGKNPVFSLLLNFGVMLAIIQVIRLVWGVAYRPFSPPDALSGSVYLGFSHFSVYRIFVVSVCVGLAILVWLLLR